MATLTATVTQIDETNRNFVVRGTIAATGSYTTAGDTLSLAFGDLPVNSAPIDVIIQSRPTTGPTNMFEYNYVFGTTPANGKMQIFTGAAAQTALTELSAGALPAGVTSDIIGFTATFQKFI